MAKKGEIDPWNIDVVELADKFLKRVEELDLRFSARVLLYAAILVRMKAEILVSEAIFDEEEVEEEQPEIDLSMDLSFELPMDEPAVPEMKPKRPKRYTTLQELIRELRKAEMLEIKRRKRRGALKEKVKEKEIWEVPHEEDIEETITRVYEELMGEFRLRPIISFFKLTRGFDSGKLISYYISILHLAYRRKVELVQERFYEDIKIRPLS